MSTGMASIGFCPKNPIDKTGVTTAVTPVSYPFRWLLLSSKHCFLCGSSRHSKKYNNAVFCLTPHQSALRLTASPQGEALVWCTSQAFPSRGRCRASARRMRWRRGQVKDWGTFLAEGAPKKSPFLPGSNVKRRISPFPHKLPMRVAASPHSFACSLRRAASKGRLPHFCLRKEQNLREI